uniref:Uncharacterized protein n=1 Tax=Fusarium oxysporum (strain Fo5176) TaxID=660025 RepID=A0A0D2Y6L1_FUSOF
MPTKAPGFQETVHPTPTMPLNQEGPPSSDNVHNLMFPPSYDTTRMRHPSSAFYGSGTRTIVSGVTSSSQIGYRDLLPSRPSYCDDALNTGRCCISGCMLQPRAA